MHTQVINSHSQATNSNHYTSKELLYKFHGRIVKSFHTLPQEGKLREVVKRVVLVAISPLVYVTLTLTHLLGRVFSPSPALMPTQYENSTSSGQGNTVSASSQANRSRRNDTSRPRVGPSDKVLEAMLKTSMSAELKKVTYDFYLALLKVNGNPAEYDSTQFKLHALSIKYQTISSLNKTEANLQSISALEKTFLGDLASLHNKNPITIFPTINTTAHLTYIHLAKLFHENCEKDVSFAGYQNDREFLAQFQLLFEDDGLWFHELFDALEKTRESFLFEILEIDQAISKLIGKLDNDDPLKDKMIQKNTKTLVKLNEHLNALEEKVNGFKKLKEIVTNMMKLKAV
jgi:hypothetical protein